MGGGGISTSSTTQHIHTRGTSGQRRHLRESKHVCGHLVLVALVHVLVGVAEASADGLVDPDLTETESRRKKDRTSNTALHSNGLHITTPSTATQHADSRGKSEGTHHGGLGIPRVRVVVDGADHFGVLRQGERVFRGGKE
jgi:hypothetical protein